MLIDAHCHLDMLEDSDKAVKDSVKGNVKIIIANGVDSKTNRKVLSLGEKYKEVKPALGIYPSDALKISDSKIDEEIDFIRKNKSKIIAIGEVGMDFKESEEKERQEKIFRKFVKLSISINKPIIVHSRKAEKECIEVLEREKAKKVVMHCFSGNFKLVQRIKDNGWTITIPTSVKNSEHFQKIAKETEIKQLLCETDSPFLHPDKKWPNIPANVIESYKKISEIKNMKLDEVEKEIQKNYKRLFE